MGPLLERSSIASRQKLALGIALAWASIVFAACAVPGFSLGDSGAAVETGGSDDGGGDDGSGTGRSLLGCNIKNVGDVSDCPGDCNAAIEGAEGVYQCTVTCDAAEQNCGDGYYCQIFQDGGTACLEDCSTTRTCTSKSDACDEVLSICLPASTTKAGAGGDDDAPVEVSVTCDFGVVEDVTRCDDDCDNPVFTGDGLYVCTNSCDVDEQDCAGPKYRCEEVDDGTGACFLDCGGGNACPDEDYACDADLELCIPVR